MADKKAILIRISHELWEELNHWAHDELRSLNGQIEYVLRESVRRRRGKNVDDDEPRRPRDGAG